MDIILHPGLPQRAGIITLRVEANAKNTDSDRYDFKTYTVVDRLNRTSDHLMSYEGVRGDETHPVTYGIPTVTWNIGSDPTGVRTSEVDADGNECVKYVYEMTYRIKLPNNIIQVSKEYFPISTQTSLTYAVMKNGQWLDENGDATDEAHRNSIDFNIPDIRFSTFDLVFTNVDIYGNPLQGARFALSWANDRYRTTRTADAQGQAAFNGIIAGLDYKLTEISPTRPTDTFNPNWQQECLDHRQALISKIKKGHITAFSIERQYINSKKLYQ